VVGCDGGRSAVRKLAGIAFPGTPPTLTCLLGDVELPGPPSPIFQQPGEGGHYSILPFEPGWFRVIVTELGVVTGRGAPPPTVADLRASLIRVAGTDFGLHSPQWISRYDDAARLAETFRSGRVLLAGDAAHTHYPAGGQGLNTGVQDAVNLGWKLAAVVRDGQGQKLLDTYASERRPVAHRVLLNTRAQTALGRLDPQCLALREVVSGLIELPDVNRSLAEMVTALDVRYPLGDRAGHRARDVELPDGSRLFDHMRTPHPILLTRHPAGPDRRAADFDRHLAGPDRRAADSDRHRADPDRRSSVEIIAWDGPDTVIRPDGHVAWAAVG
jgi:FAD binding domain